MTTSITGFTSISFYGHDLLDPNTALTIRRMLDNVNSKTDLTSFESAFAQFVEHMVNFDNPHKETLVDESQQELIAALYEEYLLSASGTPLTLSEFTLWFETNKREALEFVRRVLMTRHSTFIEPHPENPQTPYYTFDTIPSFFVQPSLILQATSLTEDHPFKKDPDTGIYLPYDLKNVTLKNSLIKFQFSHFTNTLTDKTIFYFDTPNAHFELIHLAQPVPTLRISVTRNNIEDVYDIISDNLHSVVICFMSTDTLIHYISNGDYAYATIPTAIDEDSYSFNLLSCINTIDHGHVLNTFCVYSGATQLEDQIIDLLTS